MCRQATYHRLVLWAENGWARRLRVHGGVCREGPLAPCLDRGGAEAVVPGQGPYALFTSLECATDRLRRGAAGANLAPSAALAAGWSTLPPHRGIKHLACRFNLLDEMACPSEPRSGCLVQVRVPFCPGQDDEYLLLGRFLPRFLYVSNLAGTQRPLAPSPGLVSALTAGAIRLGLQRCSVGHRGGSPG